jgi:hypothetical protein
VIRTLVKGKGKRLKWKMHLIRKLDVEPNEDCLQISDFSIVV